MPSRRARKTRLPPTTTTTHTNSECEVLRYSLTHFLTCLLTLLLRRVRSPSWLRPIWRSRWVSRRRQSPSTTRCTTGSRTARCYSLRATCYYLRTPPTCYLPLATCWVEDGSVPSHVEWCAWRRAWYPSPSLLTSTSSSRCRRCLPMCRKRWSESETRAGSCRTTSTASDLDCPSTTPRPDRQ